MIIPGLAFRMEMLGTQVTITLTSVMPWQPWLYPVKHAQPTAFLLSA